MGPSEGGKQQAETETCVYFRYVTLEKQLVDRNAGMFADRKERFSRVQHSAYQCLLEAQ